MTRTLCCLVTLFLTACGPDVLYREQVGCIELSTEFPIHEANARRLVDLSTSMFDAKFGTGTFCATAKDTYILAMDVDRFQLPVVGWATGVYDEHGTIRMVRSGCALVHEMTHKWEFDHGVISSAQHVGWEEKGYFDIDVRYSEKCHHTWLNGEHGWASPPVHRLDADRS